MRVSPYRRRCIAFRRRRWASSYKSSTTQLFSPLGPGKVYAQRKGEAPFEADANKFALFGSLAASWIDAQVELPAVVHLHDWHAGFYCLMREFAPGHSSLRAIPTVLTIHNIAYQGVRPLRGHASSLEGWFPGLPYQPEIVGDPHSRDCVNPLALAARTADRVATVSPTNATEIVHSSNPETGFVGGEGLERVLAERARRGALLGILNGCDYPPRQRRPGWARIVATARAALEAWSAAAPANAREVHELAARRLEALPKRRPGIVMTSVGRIVDQKMRLFLASIGNARAAIEQILEELGRHGVLLLLGSGDAKLEARILAIAARQPRLVFLSGYSEPLADMLYSGGDLFLMPSSFEPCGISQMLAMRAGQACVVHGVGGLNDTVEHGETGFVFRGDTVTGQAQAFVASTARAVALRANDRPAFDAIARRAAAKRFDWDKAARQTREVLYGL